MVFWKTTMSASSTASKRPPTFLPQYCEKVIPTLYLHRRRKRPNFEFKNKLLKGEIALKFPPAAAECCGNHRHFLYVALLQGIMSCDLAEAEMA